jgi:hypothetical protein
MLLPVLLVLVTGCGEVPAPALDVLGPVRLNMPEAELRASLHAAGVEPRCTESGRAVACAWGSPSSRVRLGYVAYGGHVIGAERLVVRPSGGPSAAELHGLAKRRFRAIDDPDTAVSVQIGASPGNGVEWTVPNKMGRIMDCEDVPEGIACTDFVVSIPGQAVVQDLPPEAFADDVAAVPCTRWVRRLLGSC